MRGSDWLTDVWNLRDSQIYGFSPQQFRKQNKKHPILTSCKKKPSQKDMCIDCVKEEFPERDGTCLDNGSYLLNFAGCSNCKTLDLIKISNKLSTEENGEEVVTYDHICKTCDHVIASHEYSFRVEDDEYQIYDMECLLCGRSEDQRSIMPQDPRGPMMLL